MKELTMHTTTDENFGFTEKVWPIDVEKKSSGRLSNVGTSSA
jgi:hypothetical protein